MQSKQQIFWSQQHFSFWGVHAVWWEEYDNFSMQWTVGSSWWREMSGQLLSEFWWNILSDYQVCDWGIQYHLSSTHGRLWALVVVGLSWLSGRALVTQARGVLGEIPRECWPFLYFLLFRFILIPLHDVMLTQVALACQHDSTKFRT